MCARLMSPNASKLLTSIGADRERSIPVCPHVPVWRNLLTVRQLGALQAEAIQQASAARQAIATRAWQDISSGHCVAQWKLREQFWFWALACFLLFASGGCSTHAHRLATPRHAFYSNNLDSAHAELSKLIQKPKNDATVIELDLAMVEALQGDLVSAENRLRAIRDQWDHLEKKSVLEEAASAVTDDSRRAYSGEDYEKLLVRVMLTMTSVLQDGVDAESYSLQTLSKLRDIQDRADERWGDEIDVTNYCVPPVAPYLRGVLREATWSNYDDALKFYQEASQLLPESPVFKADVERARSGVPCSPGHGVVYVFALVGRGPYKVETEATATQHALLIADQILSAVSKYSVPPTIAPVKIPEIVSPPRPFDLIGVEVNGTPITTTLPITDLNRLAVDSYDAKRTEVIGRAVARRVIKKGAVYAAKDHLDASANFTSLALDAAGVLWEASEAADTRCWGLLPREIQVARLELPVGTHSLNLEPIIQGGPIASGTTVEVNVLDANNTYVFGYWPTERPIGQILVR